MTVNFTDYLSKGGKKDRKAGVELGQANQIAFFEWLCSLSQAQIDSLATHAGLLKLSEFELDNLRHLSTFQFLCLRSGSPENYPDIFHLWTAERNGLDAILTLDKGLPNLLSRIHGEKVRSVTIRAKALRPLELLKSDGNNRARPGPVRGRPLLPFS